MGSPNGGLSGFVEHNLIGSFTGNSQTMIEQCNDIVETSSTGGNSPKHGHNEGEDRLSKLPDSILSHILSFIPIEDAVRTVLLRRFGNLWTSMQVLDFDVRLSNNFFEPRHNEWLKFFVYSVLAMHDCPTIFKFSLKFRSFLYFSPKDIKPWENRKRSNDNISHDIDSWIHHAINKKVKVLEVSILAYAPSSSRFDYELPGFVMTSDSLIEVNLVNIGLTQLGQIHMKSLKTLSLTTIMLDDSMVQKLLSGCPLLESLSIIQCCLQKLNCTSKNLKSLIVVLGEYELSKLEICGPYLKSLHISGFNGHVDLNNFSSLVEVTLDLCFESVCPSNKYNDVEMVLEKLHNANVFTIGNWCILVLTLWELTKVPCPSSSRRCMALRMMLTKWHFPGIACLLRNSPNLEMLSIYIEPGKSIVSPDDNLRLRISGICPKNFWNDKKWLKVYNFNGENYWSSLGPFKCLTNSLKTVTISGCILNSNVIQLVKFLLGSSNVLEKMVISVNWYAASIRQNPFLSEELLNMSQMVMSFPKASECVVIMFS